MKKIFPIVFFLTTVFFLAGLFSQIHAQGDYLIGLRESSGPRKGEIKREFPFINAYLTALSTQEIGDLLADSRVRSIEPDRRVFVDQVQTGAPWNLARIDQREPLGSPPDTNYHYNATGEGVTVYVIDTGVWIEHPEFEGRAIAGLGDHSDMTQCGNGHGTHVAGIIGARTYGVAKRATIISLRVFGCDWGGRVSDIVAALEWIAGQKATQNKTRIANISITGAGQSPLLEDAITAAQQEKVAVVVSAGNNTSDACFFFPAGFAPVITVGAIFDQDARAPYSNYGPCVDLFAPGHAVVSTWNSPAVLTNELNGTSMAAPHVAGVLALYLQNHRRTSPAELREELMSATTKNILANIGIGSPNDLLYSLF